MLLSLVLKVLKLSCLGESRFGRDQRSRFINSTFSTNFCSMQVLGNFVPYVKKIFSAASVNIFLFRAEITQILLSLGMTLWEELKVTVFKEAVSKNIFTMKVLSMRLP